MPKHSRPARKKNQPVDYSTFVRAWTSASCVQEVCDVTGVSRGYASVIAAELRKAGVELKKFPRNVPPHRQKKVIDVAALNAIIAGAAPKLEAA